MKITTEALAPPPPEFTPFRVVIDVESYEEARALKALSLMNSNDAPEALRRPQTDHVLNGLFEVLDKLVPFSD